MFLIWYLFVRNRRNNRSVLDTSEETSLDSETSPNSNERSRLARRFDSDETEAANMLGMDDFISVEIPWKRIK